MATIEIIDPHHHLWDLDANRYPWLQREDGPAAFGNYDAIRQNYRIEDFLSDAAGQNLVKSVHLDGGYDPSDPVAETRWLQGIADRHGFPHGIVAFADLSGAGVADILDGHLAFPNVRGIRQSVNWHADREKTYMNRPGVTAEDAWRRGFALLRDRGLSFDLQLYWWQMSDALDLARAFPDTQIILNHAGMQIDGPEHFDVWRAAMRRLAQAPNVACKISGLGMGIHPWSIDDFRPYVLAAIDAFGVDRCMFASNFPVDRLFSSYARLFDAFRSISAGFAAQERRALFHDNAERFYRL